MLLRGRKLVARGIAMILCGALVASALADVKITAEVTVTGIGDGPKTETVTTCYKGKLIRTERESTVSIYDTVKQTVTTFRKSDKTYRVLDLKKQLGKLPSVMAKLSVSTTAAVQATDATATIAGMPCKKYTGQAVLKMSSAAQPSAALPTTNILIEQWMTENIKSVSGTDSYMPLEQFIGPLKIYGGMEPIIREFSKMKGMPLSSKVTMSVTGSQDARPPIVTTTKVTAVSEAPLEDSLFQVPKGYSLAQLREANKIPKRQQP
jgi:hypothetical protein